MLFDYAGHVRVVVGEELDTSTSSYLLNLFTDEDASVFTIAVREAQYSGGYPVLRRCASPV